MQEKSALFCRGCITEHLPRNSHTRSTCADELTVEILTDAPRIVTDYLNERSIRCDYEERGCREIVQLQNLNRHVAECGFSPVVCENQGCGQTINRRDRTYHESELCQSRKLKCHTCGEISKMMVGMETKVADHDAKIALTDTKLENMDTKLANIDVNEKLNKMKANIGTKMAQTDTKLEIINTKTANLQANVEARLIRVNNAGRNENEFK